MIYNRNAVQRNQNPTSMLDYGNNYQPQQGNPALDAWRQNMQQNPMQHTPSPMTPEGGWPLGGGDMGGGGQQPRQPQQGQYPNLMGGGQWPFPMGGMGHITQPQAQPPYTGTRDLPEGGPEMAYLRNLLLKYPHLARRGMMQWPGQGGGPIMNY